YERFNGFLSRLQHNGRPGELEATMMRSWVRLHLIYNLVSRIKLAYLQLTDCGK
ncbi:hypothetical protein BD413DRAFT_476261, partial [Trametes elegans]